MIFIIFTAIAILYGVFYFEANRSISIDGAINVSMNILLVISFLLGLIGVINIAF